MMKKYYKKVGNKKIGYGAKGYRIAPGTIRGDRYCARSAGQMSKFPMSAINPNSPLRLSRKNWRCKGKRSLR
jgi:hypothetical protein